MSISFRPFLIFSLKKGSAAALNLSQVPQGLRYLLLS